MNRRGAVLLGIRSLSLAGAFVLCGGPARAVTYFGLEVGETIDTIGFSVASGGGAFADNFGVGSDVFDITATATEITTGGGAVHTEINGGANATTKGRVDLHLDLASETLFQFALNTFAYTATFLGRAGVNDVEMYAPDVPASLGGAPEQSGQLLVAGEVSGSVSIQVVFDSGFGTTPSFTVNGTFSVLPVLGDQAFKDVFGDTGDLADIISTSATTVPAITTLLADGHLFSVRNLDITADCPAAPSPCTGTYANDNGDFTFSGTGNVSPQNASAFVPEPSTFFLLTGGLLGLAAMGRRRP